MAATVLQNGRGTRLNSYQMGGTGVPHGLGEAIMATTTCKRGVNFKSQVKDH